MVTSSLDSPHTEYYFLTRVCSHFTFQLILIFHNQTVNESTKISHSTQARVARLCWLPLSLSLPWEISIDTGASFCRLPHHEQFRPDDFVRLKINTVAYVLLRRLHRYLGGSYILCTIIALFWFYCDKIEYCANAVMYLDRAKCLANT
jgi:hypothetical protein